MRCADLAEFSENLLEFCSSMVDVVNLGFGDFNETITNLKAELENSEDNPVSKLIIGTPSLVLKLLQKAAIPALKENAFSIIMDKLELMQALDFGEDLIELSK